MCPPALNFSGSRLSFGHVAKRDIIVIGASAGGVEACCEVLRGLPSDLPAAIFIVQHVGPASVLANVLAKCTGLSVANASDGESIQKGRAYVAPPDHHLLLHDGEMTLSKGPRENRQRPSVDALFRSAARAYRSRVIAVILTGALDDGAAGAFAVKRRGGVVIVQDPQTALFPSMPENARRAAPADYSLPVTKIAAELIRLVREEGRMPKRKSSAGRKPPTKRSPVVTRRAPSQAAAPFSCPDCGGPLFQDGNGPPGHLRCLIGHAYGPESLSESHRDALERALLTTIRLLKERAGVHRHLAIARNERENGKDRFREFANTAEQEAALLQEILEKI